MFATFRPKLLELSQYMFTKANNSSIGRTEDQVNMFGRKCSVGWLTKGFKVVGGIVASKGLQQRIEKTIREAKSYSHRILHVGDSGQELDEVQLRAVDQGKAEVSRGLASLPAL